MPYIDAESRDFIRAGMVPETAGELNYTITTLIEMHLSLLLEVGELDRPNYSMYNAVIGALESCKLELYRRLVASYEDEKAVENGDIHMYETKGVL